MALIIGVSRGEDPAFEVLDAEFDKAPRRLLLRPDQRRPKGMEIWWGSPNVSGKVIGVFDSFEVTYSQLIVCEQ